MLELIEFFVIITGAFFCIYFTCVGVAIFRCPDKEWNDASNSRRVDLIFKYWPNR